MTLHLLNIHFYLLGAFYEIVLLTRESLFLQLVTFLGTMFLHLVC